ncbi:MAG TPA: response regulator [Bacteroidales bacterium]|jgi:two-component system, sensor histidine kinase
MKILIAEDNILNQKIIEILIKHMGWACHIVNDGVEVVEECLKGGYDAILMDIDMPRMDGFEATSIIRTHNSDIPIIALTAFTENLFHQKSIKAGMNHFLAKPYNKAEIYNTILKYTSEVKVA